MGERTGGFLTYESVRPFVLPRTGISRVVATQRNCFEASVEGVGHAVDLHLDTEDLQRPVSELPPALRRLP